MNKMHINTLHYDLGIKDGRILRATGSEAIAQNVRERLLTIQTEWFLNLDQGLPWFSKLTGRSVSKKTLTGHIGSTVAKTVGVVRVISIDIDPPKAEREVSIDIEYQDIYGNTTKESL